MIRELWPDDETPPTLGTLRPALSHLDGNPDEFRRRLGARKAEIVAKVIAGTRSLGLATVRRIPDSQPNFSEFVSWPLSRQICHDMLDHLESVYRVKELTFDTARIGVARFPCLAEQVLTRDTPYSAREACNLLCFSHEMINQIRAFCLQDRIRVDFDTLSRCVRRLHTHGRNGLKLFFEVAPHDEPDLSEMIDSYAAFALIDFGCRRDIELDVNFGVQCHVTALRKQTDPSAKVWTNIIKSGNFLLNGDRVDASRAMADQASAYIARDRDTVAHECELIGGDFSAMLWESYERGK